MIGNKINNYRITEKIGEGGLGIVYKAQHTNINKIVAIKFLKPYLIDEEIFAKKFVREAEILSLLEHPNIVSLYDFYVNKNIFAIIMEYINGKTLDQLVDDNMFENNEDLIKTTYSQILDGFSYAHNKGIIHRDVKPNNFILKTDNTLKILDFGISKIIFQNKESTKTNFKIGSIPYMSPEQILNEDIDHRTDIFSLGITLFEILAKEYPFTEIKDNDFKLQDTLVKSKLPDVREFNSNLSGEINRIIQKATVKQKNKRYNNCQEFKIDFLKTKIFIDNNSTRRVPANDNTAAERKNKLSFNFYALKNRFATFNWKKISLFTSLMLIVLIVITIIFYSNIKNYLYPSIRITEYFNKCNSIINSTEFDMLLKSFNTQAVNDYISSGKSFNEKAFKNNIDSLIINKFDIIANSLDYNNSLEVNNAIYGLSDKDYFEGEKIKLDKIIESKITNSIKNIDRAIGNIEYEKRKIEDLESRINEYENSQEEYYWEEYYWED